MKRKYTHLKIIAAIFFLLNAYLSADSIYTEAELKELKFFFAKEESERNRKWIKDEEIKRKLSEYNESRKKTIEKNLKILENIKSSDIKIKRTKKNLVVITYPSLGRSEYDVTKYEAAFYKKKNQWTKIFHFQEIQFLYIDKDNLPDLIGSRICCANISLEVILSSENYKRENKVSPTFSDDDTFKIKYGRCNRFQMQGISWDTNKFAKFTFDCEEKKFKKVEI
ncbi:MAG: hypothetical protein KBF93_19080 [Leptospiraceae bacterium]|nr:hypothetical protein [Leptospiraceae bacterium]